MIRSVCVLCSVALNVLAEPWYDPAVNAENRLPSRTYLAPRAEFVQSLSGTWNFAWEGCANGNVATNSPERIATPFEIDVPCCVETRGWGVPHYVNIRYPHGKTPPKINPAYNPTMLYRRSFSMPEAWKGRRVVLRFEGVASCAEIWVNSKRIGYFEDARLPSEFDVTESCKVGENELCVRVRKWCDGSYVEDQDMIRLSGIFRDVKLYSVPMKGAIRDFAFTTDFSDDYTRVTAKAEVEVETSQTSQTFLLDAKGERVELGTIAKPHLWSSEDPYLYTLVMKTDSDERRMKVGLRKCEIKNGLILFNGRPIKFKGINRHEMNPDNGYAVGLGEMERDIRLMKQANFNCLRMSHYPNDPRMYELCDRYGIYVCAEANAECHGMGYLGESFACKKEWHQTFVERNVRNVLTYRNHASVVMWSVGNEIGWGEGLTKAYAAVKKIDPIRPFHGLAFGDVNGNHYAPIFNDSDVTSDMYPAIEKLLGYAKNEKPHFLCEYECAMGNGVGNMKEYWDAFYSSDKLSGGAVWDWIDQAIWKRTDRVNEKGENIRYPAYGGDWDEQPNDGPFCANGLLDAMRRPSAKLNECKHVQQPIEVTAKDAANGKAEIWNRFEFFFADEVLEGRWELFADGEKIDGGVLAVPHLAPRAKGELALPKPTVKIDKTKEHFYRVSFVLRQKEDWADKGYEVAWNQLNVGRVENVEKVERVEKVEKIKQSNNLKSENSIPKPTQPTQPSQLSQPDIYTFAWAGSEAVFSKRSGTLCLLKMNGKTIMKDGDGVVRGPRLQVKRAFTDADGWMRGPFIDKGMMHLSYHPLPIKVERNKVITSVRVTGAKSGGFVHETEWTFLADGSLSAAHKVTPFGDLPALPRLGTFQMLDGALENLSYYGRGPWENYIDRNTGCDVGRWQSTVTEQYVDYIRPQDCGGKSEVRWAEFTDPKDGKGVRIACDAPFFLQALHFTADDLDQSRHRPGEPRRYSPLVPRREVCLSVDCRQTGLGCNNCGPIPLAQYRFDVKETAWCTKYSPVK